MLHAAVLAAVLSTATTNSALPPKSAPARCFATMDGAVYHGDPSDRRLMRANVETCTKGIAQLNAIQVLTADQGSEKLFLIGRLLDRAATLSYMGLGDAPTALREVTTANLYFRVASGLDRQSADYHAAALANVELTRIQLQTLRSESVADGPAMSHRVATAYHKL